jgi:hypothetical protein
VLRGRRRRQSVARTTSCLRKPAQLGATHARPVAMRDDARDDRFAPYSTADLTVNLVLIVRLTRVMIVMRI